MANRKTGRILGYGAIFVVLGLLVYGFIFHQDIQDWYKLRGYVPPTEIADLATDTTMNTQSRQLFYVNKPQIAERDKFNQYCREDEQSIVLGCYLPGENGIYLLNVTDQRLAGIKQVTAAHEFLHAAYERLSDKEKQKLDPLLEDTFNKLSDSRIKENIELYRKQDPSVVDNELHSILGTEVRNLPPELEEYYKRYFTNRLKTVSYSEQYEQAFVDRKNAVRTYDEQLASLKSDIDSLSGQLNQTSTDLQSTRQQMNQLKTSNEIDQYNVLVPSYNSRVNSFNEQVDELSSKVTKYNDLVQERNNVASEETQLIQAMDSRQVVPQQK